MFHSKKNDDDDGETIVATAAAVAAEPARVRAPNLSNKLLGVVTPFCQAHAEQHGKEFWAVVDDLVQWAMTKAPKFSMTWEEFIRVYIQETKVETSNAATHEQKNLELLISRLEKVATSIESDCSQLEKVATSIESDLNTEISALKRSLEETRKETSDQKKELDKLRNWDTVNITWKIPIYRGYKCCSSEFSVAQYTMKMETQVSDDY
jgi:hypothetical protein